MTEEQLSSFVQDRRTARLANKLELHKLRSKAKGITPLQLSRELGLPEFKVIEFLLELKNASQKR